MSETVGHCAVHVVLRNDTLAAAVSISDGCRCRHRCTVLTGRSLIEMTGESSNCIAGFGGRRSRSREVLTLTMVSVSSQSLNTCSSDGSSIWSGWMERKERKGTKKEKMHAGNGVVFDMSNSTQTINGVSTCSPLQIPRTDSLMLSTIRPFFSGLILDPDESRISCTFLSTPFTSSRCSGTTLSRPFAGEVLAVRAGVCVDATDRRIRVRWVRGRSAA